MWCDDPPEDPVISIVAGCLANHDRAHSLSLHANHTLVRSDINRSLPHNLSVLWHLDMHGAGTDADPFNFPDSDDESPSPRKRPMLDVNREPPIPNWHLSRHQHCIDAVLNFLPADANVVLSPFSLISCMAMLCRGATLGPARDQLAHYCWPCTDHEQACDDSVALSALSAFVSQLAGVNV